MLSDELVEINQKICRLRRLATQDQPPQKKTAEPIQQEITRELEHLLQLIFSERGRTGGLDLEPMEMAMRSAMHQAGAAALGELLKCDPPGPGERQRACTCGHMADYVELGSRGVRKSWSWRGCGDFSGCACVAQAVLTTCCSGCLPALRRNEFEPIYFFSAIAVFTAERKPPGFSVPVALKAIRPWRLTI